MRILKLLQWGLMLLVLSAAASNAVAASPAPPADMSRTQALKALEDKSAEARFAAVLRLAEIGTMADADKLALHLRDDNEQIRAVTAAAMWQIWSRSGVKAIDDAYQRGVAQMQASQLREALATFSDIIKKQPGFAEAWNKRATVYFMLGEYEASLKDCDEVMKRNHNHFGALSGYGQIYIELGDYKRALTYLAQALKVNPNLPGTHETIQLLQQKLEEKQRNTI